MFKCQTQTCKNVNAFEFWRSNEDLFSIQFPCGTVWYTLECKVKVYFMSVYFSFSLTCILSVRGMHTADVMESFLISLSMRIIKIVLLCPREIVKAFKKRENREQKGMSGVYTTVLLADSMTPLWMCDFLKTLVLK